MVIDALDESGPEPSRSHIVGVRIPTGHLAEARGRDDCPMRQRSETSQNESWATMGKVSKTWVWCGGRKNKGTRGRVAQAEVEEGGRRGDASFLPLVQRHCSIYSLVPH